jgi:DNA-binding IclR family transcriptional regulator
MSKTLLRGLELIEEVSLHGPLTVTELARRTGIHVTITSRTVAACERQGWLSKVDGKISVGPRSALIGLASPVSQTVRHVEPIVRAISGICSAATAATGLVGDDVMVLAAAGSAESDLPTGMASRAPVHVMAAGRAIAAQLSTEQLDAVLPSEPFPGAGQVIESLAGSAPMRAYLASHETNAPPADAVPRTRSALNAQLDAIRAEGFARDHGELHPAVHCIAVPWPSLAVPASLACFASREVIEANRSLIESCLVAATKPGAGAQDVIRAAAGSTRPPAAV